VSNISIDTLRKTARPEVIAQDAILLLETVHRVARLLMNPAGDGEEEKAQCLGHWRHRGVGY
jgi:hypothetical protein